MSSHAASNGLRRVSEKAGPDRGTELVSARPLAEYRAMFALNDDDLACRILDCPGGGASFAAELSARGGEVVAVDPTYETSAAELGPHVLDEVDRGNQYVRDNMNLYRWTWFRDPDCHRELRIGGARAFAEDYTQHPERYRAARLPELPFEDGEFGLTLSSHLLFTYGDRLDLDFHVSAATELARVTEGEVRLYPLVTIYSKPYERLDEMRARLGEAGVESELRPVPYVFQLGADSALVLRRA